MLLTKNDIQKLDRKYRLNLINSITGIKPANLVGSRSADGFDNVAIFSSLVHLGSNPAQLGLVMRPQTNARKDTYSNIQETVFIALITSLIALLKKPITPQQSFLKKNRNLIG